METDRCPGCGARVRPESEWCSLCHQDLRPASELVTTPAGQAEGERAQGGQGPAAAMAASSPDPEPASLFEFADDDIVDAEIVDAEIVGDDGRIIAPRTAAHDVLAATDDRPPVSDAPSSPLAGLTWACKCGEDVSFEETVCPVCGGAFLGDLRDGTGGRHRPGNSPLAWLPESRQARLAFASFIAIAIAVLVPLLLSLLG